MSRQNGRKNSREIAAHLDVELLDESGQPSAFLREAPFLDCDSPMTALEWAKAVLLAPLVVLRGILMASLLLLAWLVIRVALLGHETTGPLPKWKEAVNRSVVKVLGRIMLWVGIGGKITVSGWEHFEEGQRRHAPLIFNHVSYIDALVLAAYFAPCGVAKADVAIMPVVGTITRGLQFLFVARTGTTDKPNQYTISGDLRKEVMAREVDAAFPSFMIAPEGTTKPKHCLLRFSVGGFAPGVPVQPVLLDYSRNRRFNPGWGLDQSTPWHMWRLATQFRTYADLKILPIYEPSAAEQANAKLYAENVRQLMGSHLDAPLVDYGTREEFLLKTSGVQVDWTGNRLQMLKRGMRPPILLAKTATIRQSVARQSRKPEADKER